MIKDASRPDPGSSICPHRKVPCAIKPESVALLGGESTRTEHPRNIRFLPFVYFFHGGMEKGRSYTLVLNGQPYFRKGNSCYATSACIHKPLISVLLGLLEVYHLANFI